MHLRRGARASIAVTLSLAAASLGATALGAPAVSADAVPDRGELWHLLEGVDVASPSDAWTVGESSPSSGTYFTLARHWDGTRWTTTPTPNPGASNNALHAVADIAADDAWAVGEYYTGERSSNSLILHWDGSAWIQASSESPKSGVNRFTEVDAISADNIYALGYSCEQGGSPESIGPQGDVPWYCSPLVEHWNGVRWSLAPHSLRDTASITGLNDSDVYAAGTHYIGYPLRLRVQAKVQHFDGHRWTGLRVPNPGAYGTELTRILQTAPDDVWVIGSELTASGSSGEPVTLHWDGTRWSRVNEGALRDVTSCSDLASTGPADIWALCRAPQAELLHWNGTQWRSVPFPGENAHPALNSIATESPTDGWVVGDHAPGGGREIRVLLHWDGRMWQRYHRANDGGSLDGD